MSQQPTPSPIATAESRASRRTGVLLVNLGSPDSPSTRDVRRYLREFLSDPRVLDMSPLTRWTLLNLVILPFRPRRSAAAYRKIWSDKGSPLVVYSEQLGERVAEQLGPDFEVRVAMRYGKPSIASAARALNQLGVGRIVVLPLFPQHSTAATSSALAELFRVVREERDFPALTTLGAFFDDAGFISAWTHLAEPRLTSFQPEHVLFSYHGLPEKQVRAGDRSGAHCLAGPSCCDAICETNADCYRAHCFATTRAIADALGLAASQHSSSFQSRLGRAAWIPPDTVEVLPQLAGRGIKRLAVLCPSFTADCLETLEEIGIRAREQWTLLTGGELELLPCPNAEPVWVEAVANMVRRSSEREPIDRNQSPGAGRAGQRTPG